MRVDNATRLLDGAADKLPADLPLDDVGWRLLSSRALLRLDLLEATQIS